MTPRILVVDDEEELRISVEKVLRKAGYLVDLAATTSQAREMLRRGS